MHVITKADAPRFALPGVEFVGYAAPSRGSRQVCAWQIHVTPGMRAEQAHSLDRDEVFLVTAGSIRLADGGPALSAGDAVIVPAGTPILLSNPGPEPAAAHLVVAAGFTVTLADGTSTGTPPWAQ